MDAAFLNGLQGNDLATLQRAEGIQRLEYRLELEFLRRVTLVDTPGTGSDVNKHSDRTADYIGLYRRLRERHDQETQTLGETVDAVIYVIGHDVARTSDRDFLEEFSQATQGRSRALNAIGVMGKIDLSAEILQRRAELAAKVATQLKDNLNTVVPVSAGLQRALDRLLVEDAAGLARLQTALSRIPSKRLDKLLDNSEFYLDFDDCPVSKEQRRELLGKLDWTVFTTLARALADPARTLADVAAEMHTVASFQPLRTVLEQHFFERGELLRCFRLLGEARRRVQAAQREQLPRVRAREREHPERQQRFVAFLRQAGGDPAVARELIEFIEKIAVATGRTGGSGPVAGRPAAEPDLSPVGGIQRRFRRPASSGTGQGGLHRRGSGRTARPAGTVRVGLGRAVADWRERGDGGRPPAALAGCGATVAGNGRADGRRARGGTAGIAAG